MDTFFTLMILIVAATLVGVALERNHRRTFAQPHLTPGANAALDHEIDRVLADLAARG